MSEIHKYEYKGPIMKFDICVDLNWTATTMACSESKARSNIEYQYKMANGYSPRTRITAPGKIIKID